MADDEDTCNLYEQSNLYPLLMSNKFITKQIRKHFNIKGNDDDVIPRFRFGGQRFAHWSFFSFQKRYIKSPKYPSLKQETLNNKIHCIDLKLWQETIESAYLY